MGLPWHEVARVRNNVDRVRILDLPDTPRTGYELLRFVVDEHPAGQAVEIVGFQSLQCAPPATDTPPAGHHTYTARVWGPDYSPGPMSDPIVLNVPFIDLALDPGSLRLSDDEFTPGDSVAVVVPVRNPSGLDAPAVTVSLSVAALDCAVGAHEIARTVIAVPAGSAGAAVLPYLVQDTSVVLCARVDPDGVIPEQFENNNTASRALAPDRAYRTEVWANGNLVVFACDAAVAYTVRPADGGAPRSGRLQPGTAARMALSGSASVSADAPVTVMVGSTVDATSTVVRDCNGDVRWTNAVADVPQNFFIDPLVVNRSPGTVVYAPNADAHVQASEPFRWVNGVSVPSGAALFDGVVPAGQLGWFNPHGRLNGRGAHSLRLESDVPVIAWSYADLGFAFVGADGRMTGTELHGFSAISSGQFQTGGERDSEEIVIVSYADNNRVELVRDDTGAVLDTFLLPADGIASHLIHLADNPGFMPLSVHATGTTAALNMSLAGSPAYGYAHALYIPGRSGLVFDREFIVPLTRNGRSADYAAVTALYDGTTVSVTAPDTGVLVLRRLLARGQAIDLLSEAVATDDPRRRRLVVESDRPVSVFSGTGLAAAEMVPMLSAPENRHYRNPCTRNYRTGQGRRL